MTKQSKLSFSIRDILLATALFAIICATVASGSQFLMNAFCTFTVWLLSLALLGFAICKERRRAFWGGVAVCGWIYLLATLQKWDAQIQYFMISAEISRLILPFVEKRIASVFFRPDSFLTSGMHFICACVLSLAGGYAAAWFFTDERPNQAPAQNSEK